MESPAARFQMRYYSNAFWYLAWILGACIAINAPQQVIAQESPDVSELIEQLKSTDLNTRRDAAYALSDVGPDAVSAVPALIEALGDSDQQVWFQSTMALARIGPDAKEAIPTLIQRLDDRGEQRRYRSAFCLGKIGPEAIPALLERIPAAENDERETIAQSFGWMGPQAAPAVKALIGFGQIHKVGFDKRALVAKPSRSVVGFTFFDLVSVVVDPNNART